MLSKRQIKILVNNLPLIAKACSELLNTYPGAEKVRQYLNSRINQEINNKFQFGYFPNQENINVLETLVGYEILEKEKLIFSKQIEDSLYPRMIKSCYFEEYPLLIIYKNVYGEVSGLVGRTLMTEIEREKKLFSKYKNNFGFHKTMNLFGLYENKLAIREKNAVYVVEGQFDVIKATEKGFDNIVGIGSNNMSAHQFSLLCRYTDNIFLLLDNDEAGEKGRERIFHKFSHLANIRNVRLPNEIKDIDQFLTERNLEDLEMRMNL